MSEKTIDNLEPDELVNLFADKTRRNAAVIALVGGLTATELRRVRPSQAAKQALIKGLQHPNSKVRWWCIQLMDHIADETYLPHLLQAAQSDPTPKNRRHAIHAMTCGVCKPNRRPLDIDLNLRAELAQLATSDLDESVRQMAREELAELDRPLRLHR